MWTNKRFVIDGTSIRQGKNRVKEKEKIRYCSIEMSLRIFLIFLSMEEPFSLDSGLLMGDPLMFCREENGKAFDEVFTIGILDKYLSAFYPSDHQMMQEAGGI